MICVAYLAIASAGGLPGCSLAGPLSDGLGPLRAGQAVETRHHFIGGQHLAGTVLEHTDRHMLLHISPVGICFMAMMCGALEENTDDALVRQSLR